MTTALSVKKFLFILRRPPWGGAALREGLDMILTTAAFDQSVRLLFMDDGVFLLKSTPHARQQRPPWASWVKALELYDLEAIWVEQESLEQRGLQSVGLLAGVQAIPRKDIPALLAQADIVMGA